MVVISEELVEGHLRVVEVCENDHSVIIGDLPLIRFETGEFSSSLSLEKGVSVRFVIVPTGIGEVEVEVYHVMGTNVAISFTLRLRGCGHDLVSVYDQVVKALRRGRPL